MGKNKPRHKKQPTPRRRFDDEFKVGDEVSIIRHRHGWEDGRVSGKITFLSPTSCSVKSPEGLTYQIEHPRDIRKAN